MSKEKFNNKYRIPSARLKNWDYSWNALYFITICTSNRYCFFGEIIQGNMILNKIGIIVQNEWHHTPNIQKELNLELFEFIIMPNHFHAIISIGENNYNNFFGKTALHTTNKTDSNYTDAKHCVSTGNNEYKNKFGPQTNNISSIIRGFKSSVTKQARQINPDFSWQSRFYDHIIRNENSLKQIQKYIINNPSNWNEDSLFK